MFAELHFERGRIRAVLPSPHGSVIRTETETYEFPGCHVMPGFVDSHAHLLGLGERLTLVSLHDATSADECVRRIANAPVQGGWVRAMGWNQELWDVPEMPTAAMLDAVLPDTPVVAYRVDGHAVWVNTAAIPDPTAEAVGYQGVYVDDEMFDIIRSVPPYTQEEMERMYEAAALHCAEHGITEVHDMAVAPEWLEPLRALAERGALAVRVQSLVFGQHDEWAEAGLLPAVGEFLRVCGVKMFADGALGSRGAALLSPYADADTSGTLSLTADRIVDAARRAIDAGWPMLGIHAIGDAANRVVLDAYERVRALPGGRDITLRIEHAQHVHPDDVPRFADLDVVAMVQPTHCTSDAPMAEKRLGPDRLSWGYRWRSLLDAGVRIAGGSDFPIEPADPFAAIDAFCRRIPIGTHTSWQPQECITREEAVLSMTSWAHQVADVDFRRGRIAEGYDADVVVLDRDVMSCADDAVSGTVVMATFTGGKLRYHRTPDHGTPA